MPNATTPPRWNVKSSNFLPIRRLNAYSQAKVAAALGVSRAAYTNYENGLREPSMDVMLKLADFYGVSLDELVGHTPKGEQTEALASEREFLARYRGLSEDGRSRMRRQVELEMAMEGEG